MNRPIPMSGVPFTPNWHALDDERFARAERDVLKYRPVGDVRPEPSMEEQRQRNWRDAMSPPEIEFQLRQRLIRAAGGF